MRGSNYSALTEKKLVFWKQGRSREVVAYERWSQGEVRLYLIITWLSCNRPKLSFTMTLILGLVFFILNFPLDVMLLIINFICCAKHMSSTDLSMLKCKLSPNQIVYLRLL